MECDFHHFQNSKNITPKEHFVDLKQPGVRAVMKRTTKRAAEEIGVEDFRKVSTHHFRRRFAQRLLVKETMNPRIVMQVGGWSSFQATESFLNAPSEDVVDEAFAEANIIRGA